jgi:hypothetical protein
LGRLRRYDLKTVSFSRAPQAWLLLPWGTDLLFHGLEAKPRPVILFTKIEQINTT